MFKRITMALAALGAVAGGYLLFIYTSFLEEPAAFWAAARAFLLEGIGSKGGKHQPVCIS